MSKNLSQKYEKSPKMQKSRIFDKSDELLVLSKKFET